MVHCSMPRSSAPTTTEAALLGLLVLDGPQSPYDLVGAVAGSIGFFFAPARSHVYDVLPRLERHGWARHTVVEQASRPDKRVYRATRAGRDALAAWVAQPDDAETDRSVLLLKVYFGEVVAPEVTIARLEELQALAKAALERYREIEARNAANEREFFPLLTLRHGIERTWSTIRWTDDALARIRRRVAEPDMVRSGS
jgi:DNA-binding PadR family transcriptional regulator